MRFLKLETWKTFTLLSLIPLALVIIGGSLYKQGNIQWSSAVEILSALITIVVYLAWIWLAGVRLYKLNSQNSIFSLFTFKCLLSGAIGYVFIIFPFIESTYHIQPGPVLRLLRIFSLVSFLFCIYFVASNLIAAEKNAGNSKHSIVTTFLAVWILYIGIWFVSERVKKVIGNPAVMDLSSTDAEASSGEKDDRQ